MFDKQKLVLEFGLILFLNWLKKIYSLKTNIIFYFIVNFFLFVLNNIKYLVF